MFLVHPGPSRQQTLKISYQFFPKDKWTIFLFHFSRQYLKFYWWKKDLVPQLRTGFQRSCFWTQERLCGLVPQFQTDFLSLCSWNHDRVSRPCSSTQDRILKALFLNSGEALRPRSSIPDRPFKSLSLESPQDFQALFLKLGPAFKDPVSELWKGFSASFLNSRQIF